MVDKDDTKQESDDPMKAVKEELEAYKSETKRLSRELEVLKKKATKSELKGLPEFLSKLYRESNEVATREMLSDWLKKL